MIRLLQLAKTCFAVLILILTGCTFARLATTRFEKPEFTYTGSELLESSRNTARVNFLFSVHNPNMAGVRNAFVSYELYVEEKMFLTGSDIPFELVPNGDTTIAIPATIDYRDLTPVLGSVVERILAGKKSIPVTINAVFYGRPAVFSEDGKEDTVSFEKRLTKTAEIPLVKEKPGRGK
jgi:hypothetical protein